MGEGTRDTSTVVDGDDAQTGGVKSVSPSSTSLGGRYAVMSLLGAGGMGCVYLARDAELDELVAVKVLEALGRLRDEVKLARRVTHPNIARTHDIGTHQGQRFITMELVIGEPLSAILKRGPLPVPAFLEAARALCSGLAAAHAVGIVHRDIKPANVLVASDGRVVLTDFGIACAVSSSDAWRANGTPVYMAPEQMEERGVDARTDVYALGLLFFEMLTGRRPFWSQDSDRTEEMRRRLVEPPPPLSAHGIAEEISRIIRTAMATLPEQRYATAEELRLALATVALPAGPLQIPSLPRNEARGSIAVLPPRARGDVPEGLEDHLADTLRRVGLRVPSSVAVAALTGKTPREVGRALDVDAVLDLRLWLHDEQVTAHTQVISVADGVILFELEETAPARRLPELALRLVSGVGGALHPDAPQVQAPAHLDDPETLGLYLRARRLYNQSWQEANDQACVLLESALLRRPDDPTLLAAFAAALARRFGYGADAELARARAVGERARLLAPWLPDTYLASASLHMQLAEHEAAIRDLRAALRVAPWHAEAHERLGELCAEIGLVEDAEHHLATATSLDPALEQPRRWARARMRAYLGDVEEALEIIGPPPAQEGLRNQYFMQRGRLIAIQPTAARLDVYRTDLAASAFVMKPAAEALLHVLETGQGVEPVVERLARMGATDALRRAGFFQRFRCELFAFVGRWDEALLALRASFERGTVAWMWLSRLPLLDGLRAHPEFRSIATGVQARAERMAEAYRDA